MAIWYVDSSFGGGGDGVRPIADAGLVSPGPYDTIQEAVTAASDGDTIFIINGGSTYREIVKITTTTDLTFTTNPGNPAEWSPSLLSPVAASDWTVTATPEEFSYTVPGTWELDVDPLTVYEAGVKASQGSARGSLGQSEYIFDSGTLYYRSSDDTDPDGNSVSVPLQATAGVQTRVVEASGDCSGCKFENIKFTECGAYAFYLEGSNYAGWSFENCEFDKGIQNFIRTDQDSITISGCTFSNNGTPTTTESIEGTNHEIANDTITGVDEACIFLDDVSDCRVSHNKIDTFVRSGIKVSAATATSGENVIYENEIKSQVGSTSTVSGGGIYLYDKNTDATKYDYFRGNVIYNCYENAIKIEGSNKNILANNTISYNARGLHIVKKDASTSSKENFIVNTIFSHGAQFVDLWEDKDSTNEGLHSATIYIEYDEDNDSAALVADLKNNSFRNNLYYQTIVLDSASSSDPVFVAGDLAYQIDTWKTESPNILSTGGEPDALEDDPDFLDGSTNIGSATWANVVKHDFRPSLTSSDTSPVIDAGKELGGFGDTSTKAWKDFNNFVRWGAQIDIGAFEAEQPSMYPPEDLLVMYTIPIEDSAVAGDQTTLKEATPITSYGGEASSVVMEGTGLYPNVDKTAIDNTEDRYRALDLKNVAIRPSASGVDDGGPATVTTNINANEGTLQGVGGTGGTELFIKTQADTGVTINTAWEDNDGTYQDASANDTTAPGGEVTFPSSPPLTGTPEERAGASGTTILPTTDSADGDNARFWIKRTIAATATFKEREKTVITVRGDQDSS